MSVTELERQAQEAGEHRLAYAQAQLFGDEAEPVVDGGPLAGPFCGCDTCVVREVLDAAWPYVMEIARQEARREQPMEVANLAEQREHGERP